MRKLIGFGVCLILLAIASCKNDASSDTNGFKKYTSDSLGFSMDYPQNFEAKEYFNRYIPLSFFETITDSVNDKYPENVLLYIEPIPTEVIVPFKDFIQAAKTKLKIEIPEIEISGEDSISIDGIPTGVYTIHRPKVGGEDFKSKMFILVQRDRAINISCTATMKEFDTYLPRFDKIVHSLKLNAKK